MAGGTKNVLAYDHYLRGQMLQKSADPADWGKAVASFEQAVALDPEFGQAAAKLAWMYYSARSVKSKQSALKVSGDEAWSRGRVLREGRQTSLGDLLSASVREPALSAENR